jgi:uncharacterized protein (TIGR03663 family)
MESTEKRWILDRPLAELLEPSWEKAIYLLIFVLAVVSRFWDLGTRAMSHDESLHALYSYYLYSGSGYIHNPMMHGPFLFHANALIYFLFGDNDYTARIMPALFGVFLVMSPLLLRRWLGRTGAVVASILLLISPSILYYSRYIRNDVYMAVWVILLIAALFYFIEDRKPGWFYLGAGVLMLSLATKENAYIFGFTGVMFIVELILWERLRYRDQVWLYVGGALLTGLLLVAAWFLGRPPAEATDTAEGSVGVVKLVVSLLTVVGGSIPVMLVSGSLIRSRHPRRSSIEEAIRSLPWQAWLIAIVVMFLVYTLLFTTFFTNPLGLGTGIFGSISYWLAQQDVHRGGQPWYYYILLLIMYEFVPLLFSLIAIVFYLIRGITPRPEQEPVPEPAGADDETGSAPGRRRGVLSALAPILPDAADARFVAFLIFWTISSLFLYSWARERMPWMMVHPTLPMLILTAKFVGDLVERVDWRLVWRRGGALVAVLLPLTLFGLYMLVKLQPFQGLSLSKLQETGNWFAALIVTLLLLALTALAIRRLGFRHTVMVAFVTLLVFLSFFTVRFAWMASYINYDYATEMLVYAHGAADVVPTMDEVAGISQRTVGDKMIEVAYDSDVSWPMEWYMREYPNRKFYGETPTREAMDVPVVLAGDKNDGKVQPYLRDDYYRFKRRLVWWPNQQYMDLTWERIRDILTSPEKRQALWKILYYREYPKAPDDWYHVHNFYFYVRKDVAQQLWDWGAVPPEVVELPTDPYEEVYLDLFAEQVWGEIGVGPGQFNHPRGVAVGPGSEVYVVDSDNFRVQVFDASGAFLREWGSQCNLADGHGCVDPDGAGPLAYGDGQFQEPWGIAVDGEGRVYVADTWNHRVQVFDASGAFLAKWGRFGQVDGAVGGEAFFWGPRDVAVDEAGRVFVTDTGNKRVMVFDADGRFLHQWGGGGVIPGSFEEPVGLALDAEGNLYVADTWNGRVQVFDGDYVFLREWPVEAWYGESVVNKPFLAVDGQGRVYVTDPEGYRVIVFDGAGELVATFGLYGLDTGSFTLPTGIAVDGDGNICVTDTDGQRVMRFGPLP